MARIRANNSHSGRNTLKSMNSYIAVHVHELQSSRISHFKRQRSALNIFLYYSVSNGNAVTIGQAPIGTR
jgi:hypothetical protein